VDEMLADKVVRIPVPPALLQALRERMKCLQGDFDTPCGVLTSLETGRPMPIETGGPWFGHSWEIGRDGHVEKTFHEVLQIKATDRGMRALWMPVRPDNNGEKAQLEAIIARQKGGDPANASADLAAYLGGMFMKIGAPLKSGGDNRAFLSTKGNTAQLLRVQEGYVLIVATEHWTGIPEKIILAYFWSRAR